LWHGSLEEFVLGKDRDWTEMLFNVTRDRLVSFLSLPSEFQKLIGRTVAGKISFHVDGLTSGSRLLYAAAHQIVFALGACMAGGVAMYLHHAGETEFARYAAYAGCGFASLVLVSMIRARRFRHR